jgi:hypothetical protein
LGFKVVLALNLDSCRQPPQQKQRTKTMCGVSTSNMTQWQFLIQKEGDQDWLPLESSSAEILEGRYQLVVQSSQPNASVDVQIRHEYEMGGILQEVTQRRRQQADTLGRFDLLSSTYLPPGLWELKCRATQDQQDGKPFPPKKLLLQVLAQEFETLSDWEVLEPSSQGAIPEQTAIAPPHLSTDEATPIAQALPTPKIDVALPIIPRDVVPITLHTVQGLQLPPIIFNPGSKAELPSPQLPDFLPPNSLWSAPEPTNNIPMADYLDFLRRVAKSTDRDAVYQSFESLEWRQRFLSTLDILAQPCEAPETTPQVAALV